MLQRRAVSAESIALSECHNKRFELNLAIKEEAPKLSTRQRVFNFVRKLFRVVQQSEKEPWGKV
jgi:hypothetical protein